MTRLGFRRRERGAVAITLVLMLAVLGAFLALGLNTGNIMSTRNQLQNQVDSAALAGAMELDGTSGKLVDAHLVAKSYAERHSTDKFVFTGAYAIDANEDNDPNGPIVHGRWDMAETDKAIAFTPDYPIGTVPSGNVNAVLVRSGRDQRNQALPVHFTAFLGISETNISSEAVAVGGAPGVECAVPITFADCLIDPDSDGVFTCHQELFFSSDGEDFIGFTNLGTNYNTNAAGAASLLTNLGCATVDVGDPIEVQNGNDLNQVNSVPWKALITTDPNNPRWLYAPVVHADGCDPGDANAKFNGVREVTGFASFYITAVHDKINPPDIKKKSIVISFECNHSTSDETPAGGSFYGTDAPYTRLVR
jgi:Flp pilus assembly protein TadG